MQPEFSESSSHRQPVVFLDVGGTLFKMSKENLTRFPDSLLSKLVREFPELVEKGEQLFIDRNPRPFPWILEIYRDGDYDGVRPPMSREQLQKELDFYQLPNFDDLQMESHPLETFSRDAYAQDLMEQILREIDICGLQDFFPWTVLIYHKIVDGIVDPARHIYVSPPLPMPDASFIDNRGHREFDKGLQMEGEMCPRLALGDRTKLSPFNQNCSYLIWKKGYAFIELLQAQAEKYGMELEEAKHATFYLSNGKMVYGHFILDYKE